MHFDRDQFQAISATQNYLWVHIQERRAELQLQIEESCCMLSKLGNPGVYSSKIPIS